MAFRLVPVRLAIVVTLSDSVRICSRNAVARVALSFFAVVLTSDKWPTFGPLSRIVDLAESGSGEGLGRFAREPPQSSVFQGADRDAASH